MSGISINIKIGDRLNPDHPNYFNSLLDGQIVDIRPIGYYDKCLSSGKYNAIIDVPTIDFDELRGTVDWKSEKNTVYDNWKKYLAPTDSQGKYPWDFGYIRDEVKRYRDWFIDFKELQNLGIITKDTYGQIYNYDIKHKPIIYNGDIFQLFRHEDVDNRLVANIKNQPWGSGTKTIGAAGDATDLADALSKTANPLTGNLTWEHLNEETTISAGITWDIDLDGNLLKITAQSGAEHNGGAYGNGARIACGTYDEIQIGNASDSNMANVEISKLALDITGAGNYGIELNRGANTLHYINRMLIAGDTSSFWGIYVGYRPLNVLITNNIIYGVGNSGTEAGIAFLFTYYDNVLDLFNNTVIGCYNGIANIEDSEGGVPVKTIKNNLVQASGNVDFYDAGSGWGTTAYNVTEDSTGPDAAYDDTDVHTNSVFEDYGNDDYRLDPDGDSTNLAILDDGEDLSGTFTDDIQGQARSTWYIGASEIVSAPPPGISIFRRRIEGY